MTSSVEEHGTTIVQAPRAAGGANRSLVLVVGSGRSGTSLFSGILQRLGFYVPQPEVPANDTNPRGFAESRWVVDFHMGLLRDAGVQMADARPSAWLRMGQVNLEGKVERTLGAWLRQQFGQSGHLVIKDPRLSWFVPVWRRCAEGVSVQPKFVTVLRHPATVIDSKQRWYGPWQSDVSRTAGWLNQMLFTERATRDAARAFVRYDDLLEDWTKTVARVGKVLDLAMIREAEVPDVRRVHEFVDRGLSRSQPSWEDVRLPAELRELADQVWELLSGLADDDAPAPAKDRFDAARAAYVDLYEGAEAIAQSSVVAARGRRTAFDHRRSAVALRLVERVPRRYRRKVPARWRARVVRALNLGH